MRYAAPVLWTLAVALTLGGCGDDPEEAASSPEADASVTVDDVRNGDGGAAAAEAAAAETPEETSAPRTHTLYSTQVGAFVQERNAEALSRRLEEADLPVWTATAEVDGRRFRRVRVGALSSVADARRLGSELGSRLEGELDFWIAPVPPDDELPPGALE